MKPKPIEHAVVSECVEYCSYSGVFTWKKYPKNNRAGMNAGREKKGYMWLTIKGQEYPAGRVAWVLVHGSIPENMQIDHINRNGLDNRLCNLRLVTCAENNNNRSNRYGEEVPRYYTTHSSGKFQVIVKGKYIGLFSTKDEAQAMASSALK